MIIVHLSKLWEATFFILWCDISGEAHAGELWNWSLLGVRGLIEPQSVRLGFGNYPWRADLSVPCPAPSKKERETNEKAGLFKSVSLFTIVSINACICYALRKWGRRRTSPRFRPMSGPEAAGNISHYNVVFMQEVSKTFAIKLTGAIMSHLLFKVKKELELLESHGGWKELMEAKKPPWKGQRR